MKIEILWKIKLKKNVVFHKNNFDRKVNYVCTEHETSFVAFVRVFTY